MITSSELAGHLRTFAATISADRLGLALQRPEAWAIQTQCFTNVEKKVARDGGSGVPGWMFHHRLVVEIAGPGYLIAVHHAVWRAPSGHLMDVTPVHSDPKHWPYSINDGTVFLVDFAASPVTVSDRTYALPSRFFAIGNGRDLIDHVERLNWEEQEQLRRQQVEGSGRHHP